MQAPGRGTRSHRLQLNIPCATTMTWHSLNKLFFFKQDGGRARKGARGYFTFIYFKILFIYFNRRVIIVMVQRLF